MFVYVRSVSLKYWESIFKVREVAEKQFAFATLSRHLCSASSMYSILSLLRSRFRRCYIRVTDCQGFESTLTIMSPFSPVSGIVQLFLKSIPLVLGTNLSLEVLKSISNLQDNMLKKESRQHTSCSQECSQTSGFTFV